MSIRTLQFPYPDDLPQALGETPEEFEAELKFLVAAKLYELVHRPRNLLAVVSAVKQSNLGAANTLLVVKHFETDKGLTGGCTRVRNIWTGSRLSWDGSG